MKLFEIAITRKNEKGEYSIISVPNQQIMAKNAEAAGIEAARQIPADVSSNEVNILVRPFV